MVFFHRGAKSVANIATGGPKSQYYHEEILKMVDEKRSLIGIIRSRQRNQEEECIYIYIKLLIIPISDLFSSTILSISSLVLCSIQLILSILRHNYPHLESL